MKNSICIGIGILVMMFLSGCMETDANVAPDWIEKDAPETEFVDTVVKEEAKEESSTVEHTFNKYEDLYIDSKSGVWLKTELGGNEKAIFVEYNEALTAIREGFVEEDWGERRWLYVKSANGAGWIESRDYSCRDDEKMISLANEFIENLKNKSSLAQIMSDSWEFVYHEDNRGDGSTDGGLVSLEKSAIDNTLTFDVHCDGEGWFTEEPIARDFEMTFSLKKIITDWSRLEMASYSDHCEKIVYILGKGESDYLILHLGETESGYAISKLEYRSEDPG